MRDAENAEGTRVIGDSESDDVEAWRRHWLSLKGRRLSTLRREDRKKWAIIVKGAVKSHALRLPTAARELGIGHRTLQRWANELGLPRAPHGVHVG